MVMGESLFSAYDFNKKNYHVVPDNEYHVQVKLLKAAQATNPKLGVYTLDYWDPKDSTTLKTIYRQERETGFIPYVATVNLDAIVKEPLLTSN